MKQHLPFLAFLCACAAEEGGPTPDANQQPVDIAISGQAAKAEGTGIYPLSFLRVNAYLSSDEVTPIAETTSDMLGNYSITIHTAASRFDGYLRAREIDLMDTYLYFPDALANDFTAATLRMVHTNTFGFLSDLCAGDQLSSNGFVTVKVIDEAGKGVPGVTLASSPAANKYCYNDASGFPESTQLSTSADGSAYLFNVTGPVTVSATKAGSTFKPRTVTARAGVITMVLIN